MKKPKNDSLLDIPIFLQRKIKNINVVGYTRIKGKLYKIGSDNCLYDADTNKKTALKHQK